MRVVLDTNVVVSALLWGGTPERLIELAGEGSLELFTSEALLAELAGILGRSKFAHKLRQKNLSAAEIVAHYRRKWSQSRFLALLLSPNMDTKSTLILFIP